MRQGIIVVYDDSCGFCRACRRWLERLDWMKRLTFVPLSSPELFERFPDLATAFTGPALPNSMLVRPPDGHWRIEAEAIRQIARHLPAGFLLAPLLGLPGFRWLVTQGYRAIAQNRHCLIGKQPDATPPAP